MSRRFWSLSRSACERRRSGAGRFGRHLKIDTRVGAGLVSARYIDGLIGQPLKRLSHTANEKQQAAEAQGLHVEAELDDVAVGDGVFLALEPDELLGLRVAHRAGLDVIVEREDLGPNEAAGHIRVDGVGGLDG